MTSQHRPRNSSQRFLLPMLVGLVMVLGIGIYAFRCDSKPAGFYVDESSIAYNAYTISQTGRDEHGKSWPLFFRAFGDYKNPVYVYLLALIFKLTGPSIFAARLFSALCGVSTALLLFLLVFRIAKSAGKPECALPIGLLIMTTAFVTPWLFEISRVTLEVALFPATVLLFLISLQRSSNRPSWRWSEVLCLASTLALITYTYSIGRMLAPLLAFGLIIFATRERLAGIVRTWAIYLASLIPLVSYQRSNNGALTDRFKVVTYLKPGTSLSDNVWQFVKHFAANLDPRRIFWNGDPNLYQVVHVYGKPALLLVTMILLAAGIWLVLRHRLREAWWRFILYGTVASVIPASLTDEYFHTLRLVALPIFLLILTVPALLWLFGQRRSLQRVGLAVIVGLTLLQGVYFQFQYHRMANDPWRRNMFDADYEEKIFKVALARRMRPIYLADAISSPYIQAFWYGAVHGIPHSDFVRLRDEEAPPEGALVISTEESCLPPSVIAHVEPYSVYVADRRSRPRTPLPEDAFRAELSVTTDSLRFQRGQQIQIPVVVKNNGNQVWPGCKRGAATFQIYLASHWLDGSGNWVKEEGRAPLSGDLEPGQTTTLKFKLGPPVNSGDYMVELDMLQEGVTWFGLRGSPTKKVRIVVE